MIASQIARGGAYGLRCFVRSAFLRSSFAFAAAALSCFAPSASAASSSVVISQIYGAGGNSGAAYQNDYVELFNLSGAPVSVAGWSVQYASATGTGNFSSSRDDLSGTIPAGGYYLVKLAGGTSGGALPAADATGTTNMAAGGGKVIVANVATGLACNGSSTPCSAAQLAQIVDLVGQGSGKFLRRLRHRASAEHDACRLPRRQRLHGHRQQQRRFRDRRTEPAQQRVAGQSMRRRHQTPPSGTGAASPASVIAGGNDAADRRGYGGREPDRARFHP